MKGEELTSDRRAEDAKVPPDSAVTPSWEDAFSSAGKRTVGAAREAIEVERSCKRGAVNRSSPVAQGPLEDLAVNAGAEPV